MTYIVTIDVMEKTDAIRLKNKLYRNHILSKREKNNLGFIEMPSNI